MVNDAKTNAIISWDKTGKSFVVRDVNALCQRLPKIAGLFTPSFGSFVNELSIYGFAGAIAEDGSYVFSNDAFQRGKPEMLRTIRRKENFGRYRRGSTRASAASLSMAQ